MNKRTFRINTLATAITWLLAALWGVPLVWAILVSFRSPVDPLGSGDVWLSLPLSIESYQRAWTLAPFDLYYVNTMIVVLLILGIQLITITLAAFAFVQYRFLGQRILFLIILTQLMIPSAALIVPNFSTIRSLGLFDTRLAIALPYFGSAFGTFLLRQAFLEIPRDLIDAGMIDGCSWRQLLWNVYLPSASPMLVAFAFTSVSAHWNEFLWPLVITNSDSSRPLTAGLARFTQMGEIGAQWSLLMAATLTVIAPLLVVFVIFQRRFVQSFLQSGLK